MTSTLLPTASRPTAVFGAQYAPLSSSLPSSNTAWWSRFVRRGLSSSQWDVELVLYQLWAACASPRRLSKLTQTRKQTKNAWARDDPVFLLLLLALLTGCSLAFSVAYSFTSPLDYAWLATEAVFNFFASGVVVCSIARWVANTHLRASAPAPHSVEQEVEWMYAWDVHCNSYVALLGWTHVGVLLGLPYLMSDGWGPTLVGNAIYAAAYLHYLYVTFSGYLGECVLWGGRGESTRLSLVSAPLNLPLPLPPHSAPLSRPAKLVAHPHAARAHRVCHRDRAGDQPGPGVGGHLHQLKACTASKGREGLCLLLA